MILFFFCVLAQFYSLHIKPKHPLFIAKPGCDATKQRQQKIKLMLSQQRSCFWLLKWSVGSGCRGESHTRTTFTRDAAVSLAKTKPYHYPNHSHLCALCQDETRCTSHTNKTPIARCRAGRRPRSPPSCSFARVVGNATRRSKSQLKGARASR